MNNVGWYLLGFILVVVAIAVAAIALDIWLDAARRRSRYRERFADEHGHRRKTAPNGRFKGLAWIVLVCTIVGVATLFAIAHNTATALGTEHSWRG